MKKRIFIGVIVLIATSSGGVFVMSHDSVADDKDMTPITKNVRMVSVTADHGTHSLAARGVVAGVQEVQLAPKIAGRVTALYADMGDAVYKGQLLATIDGAEVQAQAAVAHSGVTAAENAVTKTAHYFDDQVDQAKKARSLAEDAYDSAKDSGDSEKIAEAKADYGLAKKAYESAKSGRGLQVKLAEGQRDIARSQLVAAQVLAANTQLRAPFSGVIAARNAKVGSLVAPEGALFTIVQGTQKQVDISLTAGNLDAIAVGDGVRVIGDDGHEEQATISAVSPMINTQTRKGLVRVRLASDTTFVLGTYVQVLLDVDRRETASENMTGVRVPRAALVPRYHDMTVFVVREGHAQQRTVQIGLDDGETVVVTDGLAVGEDVIVAGQQYLQDGEAVTATE